MPSAARTIPASKALLDACDKLGMARFYRHVLIQKRYPHHGAVAFSHFGCALFEVFKLLGITDIAYNQPRTLPYPSENPFR